MILPFYNPSVTQNLNSLKSMPELPEVETSRRGLEPLVCQQQIRQVIVRQPRLRWQVPENINKILTRQTIQQVTRRGKYLLFNIGNGTLIIHLGMSGRLRVLAKDMPAEKHDHIDIILSNNRCLRFTDPRRFGTVLWTDDNPLEHFLLKNLGPEPLSKKFHGAYLFNIAVKRKVAIKQLIMDSHIVVGIGNIYANEALFHANIHPNCPSNQISLAHYHKLASAIKDILKKAIACGGTTLKDFQDCEGKPGYFKQELFVYGRANLPCLHCEAILSEIRLGQRSTVFCHNCQPL